MTDVIEVRDVVEKNNCAGKKHIYVTSMGSDELHATGYELNPGWCPPHTKLELATVAPMDRVRVVTTNPFYPAHPMIIGEYVENLSETYNREPICRCGTRLVSDGFIIVCPNPVCALTLTSRFERLARTKFFDFESITNDAELCYDAFSFGNKCHPFGIIEKGLTWGSPGGSLEHVLLRMTTKRHSSSLVPLVDAPSLATFLVPEFFEGFMEDPSIPTHIGQEAISNIQYFYGWMEETINRRDTTNQTQYMLLCAFLWSLGIESLRPETIEAMLVYEDQTAIRDPMVLYAFVLTNVSELVNEFGLHPLEAQTIVAEVGRRQYELHDIFYHYALNKGDITRSFSQFK